MNGDTMTGRSGHTLDDGIMPELHDAYTTGLRNAHALEQQALAIMDRQIDRLVHFAELDGQLKMHRGETERQIARLEQILDELDERPSALKDAAMKVGGNIAALGHSFADDEILKNTFSNVAFENYEIASYLSLIEMAQAAGLKGHVMLLEETLAEERAMAHWLTAHVGDVTRKYLSLRAAPGAAPR